MFYVLGKFIRSQAFIINQVIIYFRYLRQNCSHTIPILPVYNLRQLFVAHKRISEIQSRYNNANYILQVARLQAAVCMIRVAGGVETRILPEVTINHIC